MAYLQLSTECRDKFTCPGVWVDLEEEPSTTRYRWMSIYADINQR